MRGYHDATRELPRDTMGGATTTRQGSYHDPLSMCGHLVFLVFSFVVILSVVQPKEFIFTCFEQKTMTRISYFSDKLMEIISPSPLRGSLNVPSTARDQVKCIFASFSLDLVSRGFTVNIFYDIFHCIFRSIMSISLPNNQKRSKNVTENEPKMSQKFLL